MSYQQSVMSDELFFNGKLKTQNLALER